jgi:hypothetical protein
MPLLPAEKAALALWLTSARNFDADCWRADDQCELDEKMARFDTAVLEAARGSLHGDALGAGLRVSSDADIPQYLNAAADKLATCISSASSPLPSVTRVSAAQTLLRQTAESLLQSANEL